MRFQKFINELSSDYGKGITFVDIDETLFHTFAKIKVIKNGKVVKELNNQEFNTYEKKPGESFDFEEFKDANLFVKTSIPISQTINRVKRMIRKLKDNERGSRIIFLTARSDFDDKHTFLNVFKEHGIDTSSIYIERAGNLKTGTVASTKEKIIMNYIKDGDYRRVRMIDDDMKNLHTFLNIKNKISKRTLQKVKEKHNIDEPESIEPIEFYALLVTDTGKLKRIS